MVLYICEKLNIFFMKHKVNVIIILVIGVLITSFGYLVDSDPAYANIWHTVTEFVMMSTVISGLLAIPYVIFWGIRTQFAKKS